MEKIPATWANAVRQEVVTAMAVATRDPAVMVPATAPTLEAAANIATEIPDLGVLDIMAETRPELLEEFKPAMAMPMPVEAVLMFQAR